MRIKYFNLVKLKPSGKKEGFKHRFEPVGWFCRGCKSFVTDDTRILENFFNLEDKFPDLRVVYTPGRHNCYHCGHDDQPVYYRPNNTVFMILARYCGLCYLFALEVSPFNLRTMIMNGPLIEWSRKVFHEGRKSGHNDSEIAEWVKVYARERKFAESQIHKALMFNGVY